MAITKEGSLKIKGEVDTKQFDAMITSLANIEKGFNAMGKAMLDIKTEIITSAFEKLKESVKGVFDEGLKWGHLSEENMKKVEGLADVTKKLISEESAWRGIKKLQEGDLRLTTEQMNNLAKAAVLMGRRNNEDASASFERLTDAIAGGRGAQKALYQMGITVDLVGTNFEKSGQALEILKDRLGNTDIELVSSMEKTKHLSAVYEDLQRTIGVAILKSDLFKSSMDALAQSVGFWSDKFKVFTGSVKQGTSEYYDIKAKELQLAIEAERDHIALTLKAQEENPMLKKMAKGMDINAQLNMLTKQYEGLKHLRDSYRADEAKEEYVKNALEKQKQNESLVGFPVDDIGIPAKKHKGPKKKTPMDLVNDALKEGAKDDSFQNEMQKLQGIYADANAPSSSLEYFRSLRKPSDTELVPSRSDSIDFGVKQQMIGLKQQELSIETQLAALKDPEVKRQQQVNQGLMAGVRAQEMYNDAMNIFSSGGMGNQMLDGLGQMGGALWNAADAAITSGASMGKAVKMMLKQVMYGIAAESTVKALQATALGFYNLAIFNYPGAAQAFTSAGLYAATAAATGGVGIGLSYATKDSGASGAAAKNNSEGYKPTFGTKGSDQQNQIVVQVYFDRSDPAAESFATRQIKARMAA